jgi:hypothetical protein
MIGSPAQANRVTISVSYPNRPALRFSFSVESNG